MTDFQLKMSLAAELADKDTEPRLSAAEVLRALSHEDCLTSILAEMVCKRRGYSGCEELDMWYHYNQNNSGGSFTFDKKAGITHHVLIEAASIEAADERADNIGIYFDGVDNGEDCDCCGDRWSRAYGKGDKKPMVYGEPVTRNQYQVDSLSHLFMSPNAEAVLHPLKGTFKWIKAVSRKRNPK